MQKQKIPAYMLVSRRNFFVDDVAGLWDLQCLFTLKLGYSKRILVFIYQNVV